MPTRTQVSEEEEVMAGAVMGVVVEGSRIGEGLAVGLLVRIVLDMIV
jgi:hypothetical protein